MRPLILSSLFLGLVACQAPPPEPEPTPVLRIAGSESLTSNLMPRLAEAFEQSHPHTEVVVTGGGTSTGMRSLLAGEIDMAAASRPHTPAEEEQAKVNGYSLAEADTIVAVDTVVVSVSASVPLDSITYGQVIGIFCSGEIGDWSQLGLEVGNIASMSRGTDSGTRALFEDFFCGPGGLNPSIAEATTGEITAALAQKPGVIAYASMTEGAGKVLNLRPEPEAPPISPTLNNIARGAYPLSRDLHLYTAGTPDPLEKQFLDFVASDEGQAIVSAAGFVPLMARPELMDEPRPLREIVQFEEGSDAFTSRSQARLGALIDELKQKRGSATHVVLEGYADAEESDKDSLSEKRALRVKEAIEGQISGLFFELIPRGDERPIAPNGTPTGRERNRRVQVYLASEEAPELDPSVRTVTEKEEG